MLASVGYVILSGIYFLLARMYKKTDGAPLVRSAVAGTRRTVGTIATVAAVFVLVESVMVWASGLDWSYQWLLTIEQTLSQIRSSLDSTVKSPYFFLAIGAVLVVLISLPSICVLSGIARRFLTGAEWLTRVHFVLVIVTSLTFFGTGTRDGLAKMEASLVENRKKVERGLEDVENWAQKTAPQIVEHALSEIFAEIQREIAELINNLKLSGGQVAKAKSTQASVTSFIQPVSEFEAAPPPNRTVSVEKLKTLRPDATLGQVQQVQAELKRSVAPKPNPMSPDRANEIDRALRLSVSQGYDQVAALLLHFPGGESALYDILKLFIGETFERQLKEMLHVAATQLLKGVFVDGCTPAEAYNRAKQEVKRDVRLRSVYNRVLGHIKKEKMSLALADLSEKFNLRTPKKLPPNPVAEFGLEAFPWIDASKQLRGVDSPIVPLPQDESILKGIKIKRFIQTILRRVL